ncbi:DVUA0089 family protein [Nostoc sp. FACHB-973]|nr:DVUA0089 family protein [Nostoc sp. FACHB-973]
MASIISSYDTPGNSYGITIVGNYAYIADGDKGLQILDISNPKLPKLIGNYLIPNKSSAYEVVVAGNYAYIAADTEGVFVINISNPAQPTLANTYRSRGIAAKDIYVVGNTLYVAESTGYFAIVDITNPSNPIQKSRVVTSADASDVKVSGKYAYVTNYNGKTIDIFDISNSAQPIVKGKYQASDRIWAIEVVDNYAYVAADSAGLYILNITNPASPTLVAKYDTPGIAYGVSVKNNRAYVADSSSGLLILDITNPAKPQLLEIQDTAGSALDVQVVNNYAYVADADKGLQIVDLNSSDTFLGKAVQQIQKTLQGVAGTIKQKQQSLDKLPIIGDLISKSDSFNYIAQILPNIEAELNKLNTAIASDVKRDMEALKNALNTAFNAIKSGINLSNQNTNSPFNLNIQLKEGTPTSDANLSIDANWVYELFNLNLDKRFGMPDWLPLSLDETTGKLKSTISVTFKLSMGYNANTGFYIETDKEKTNFKGDIVFQPVEDLNVKAKIASLPVDLSVTSGRGLTAQFVGESEAIGGGKFIRTIIDAKIDENWKTGSPFSGLKADKFSVRWTGQIKPPTNGDYIFYVSSDELVRLWIDGKLVIDAWRDQKFTENASSTIKLEAGKAYDIQLDYYEKAGDAAVKLMWQQPNSQQKAVISQEFFTPNISQVKTIGSGGLYVQYYNNSQLIGLPSFNKFEPGSVNEDWGSSSPNSLDKDNFGGRWLGQLTIPQDGNYTFQLKTEFDTISIPKDGARFWLQDGTVKKLIDIWDNQKIGYSGVTSLKKGTYNIQVDYHTEDGDASVQLLWQRPNTPFEIIPPDYLNYDPSITTVLVPSEAPVKGLTTQYFNNSGLIGLPAYTDITPTISFYDYFGEPLSDFIYKDNIGVRWLGQLKAPTDGTYKFRVTVSENDIVSFWLGGQQYINKKTNDQNNKEISINLTQNQLYDLQLDFSEFKNSALVQFQWQKPGGNWEYIPPQYLSPKPLQLKSDTGFKVEYFEDDGGILSVSEGKYPVVTTVESQVKLTSKPNYISTNKYITRWTGQFVVNESGKYTFRKTDQTAELMINGMKLKWNDNIAEINLTPGKQDLQLRVINDNSLFQLELENRKQFIADNVLVKPGTISIRPTTGLSRQVYNAKTLAGLFYDYDSLASFTDFVTSPTISQNWGYLSPLGSELDFRAVYTGRLIAPYTGDYIFSGYFDDSATVTVNDFSVLIQEKDGSSRLKPKIGFPIYLQQGKEYDFKLDFKDKGGEANLDLFWTVVRPNLSTINEQVKTQYFSPNSLPRFQAQYFGDKEFKSLAKTNYELDINHDWGNKELADVNDDEVSVRWTGKIQPKYSEKYTFTVNVDDGVRLWIGDQLIIDRWQDGSYTGTGAIDLNAGQVYDLKMEYYENEGDAKAQLYWQSQSQGYQLVKPYDPTTLLSPNDSSVGDSFRAYYYNNQSGVGEPVFTRLESDISKYWGKASPIPNVVKEDDFSVRWIGSLTVPTTGTYTFYLDNVDEYAYLQLSIPNRTLPTSTLKVVDVVKSGLMMVYLNAGETLNIDLFYRDSSGNASVELYWQKPNSPTREILKGTDIILDGASSSSNTYKQSLTGAEGGFLAEYFSNTKLEGTPNFKQYESRINNAWGISDPIPGIIKDGNYSISWTGQIQPKYSEDYTFYARANDGVRVWLTVGGVETLIIDRWPYDAPIMEQKSSNIRLQAGQIYDLKVKYFSDDDFYNPLYSNDAAISISWSSKSQSIEPIPAYITPPGSDVSISTDETDKPQVTETKLSLGFDLGLNDPGTQPGTDKKLTLGEALVSLAQLSIALASKSQTGSQQSGLISTAVNASAAIGLTSRVQFPGGYSVLPSLGIDLDAVLPETNLLELAKISDLYSKLEVQANTKVYVGSLVQNYLVPLLNQINEKIDPIRPVIEFLQKDTKLKFLLGNSYDLDKDDKINVLELILNSDRIKKNAESPDATQTGSSSAAQLLKAFNTITKLIDIADKIEQSLSDDLGETAIDLGKFPLSDIASLLRTQKKGDREKDAAAEADPFSSVSADSLKEALIAAGQAEDLKRSKLQNKNTTSTGTANQSTQTQLPASGASSQKATNTVSSKLKTSSAAGFAEAFTATDLFSFPILDNPTSILGLLVGQKDVTLAEFTLPTFNLGASIEIPFPITIPAFGVIGQAFLKGGLGLQARFGLGYDTTGLVNWKDNGFALNKINNLFTDGLYIKDTYKDETGVIKDLPELQLNASLAVGAYLGNSWLNVGIIAGIKGEANLDLNDLDGDGKVRISQIANAFTNFPDNIGDAFVLSGKISAFAEYFYTALSLSGGDSLGEIDLISFDTSANKASVNAEDTQDTVLYALNTNISNKNLQFTHQGVIGDGNYANKDVDFFSVYLKAGEVITIDIDTVASGLLSPDLSLRVFDSQSLKEVGYSNNGAAVGEDGSNDPYLRFQAQTDGLYYIGVSTYASDKYLPWFAGSGQGVGIGGNYTLNLNLLTHQETVDNDILSRATVTGLTSAKPFSYTGYIGNNPDFDGGQDIDFFAVEATAGEILTINAVTSDNSSLDTYFRVFNPDGKELHSDTENKSFVIPRTGTYYIGISDRNNDVYDPLVEGSASSYGFTGEYKLTLQLQAKPLENNNNFAQAIETKFNANVFQPFVYKGIIGDDATLAPDRDVDYFQVDLVKDRPIQIRIDSKAFRDALSPGNISYSGAKYFYTVNSEVIGANLDSWVRVYNAAGDLVAEQVYPITPDDFGSIADYQAALEATSFVSFTPEESGKYYVSVSNYANQYSKPGVITNGTQNPESTYIVNFDQFGDTIATATVVNFDTNNTSLPYYNITSALGDNQNVEPGQDVDFWAIELKQGEAIAVDVSSIGSNNLDAYLRLFDANGQQLVFSDDRRSPQEETNDPSTYTFDPYLTFTAPNTGTYYLGLSTYESSTYKPNQPGSGLPDGATGEYSLSITKLPNGLTSEFQTTVELSETREFTGAYRLQIQADPIANALPINTGNYSDLQFGRFYSVYLDAGDKFKFDVDQQISQQLGQENPFIYLLNSAGKAIGFNEDAPFADDKWEFPPAMEFVAAQAGYYYVYVNDGNFSNSSPEHYFNAKVEINPPESNLEDVDDSVVENATVTNIIAGESNSFTHKAYIGNNNSLVTEDIGDVDLYKVELAANQLLSAELWVDKLNFQFMPILRVFDVTGQEKSISVAEQPQEIYGYEADYDHMEQIPIERFPTRNTTKLNFLASTAGTYYVGVSHADNATYNPTIQNSSSDSRFAGEYTLNVSTNQALTPEIVSNDTPETANQITLSPSQLTATYTGTIGDSPEFITQNSDVDFVKLNLRGGDKVKLDLQVLQGLNYFTLNIIDPQGYNQIEHQYSFDDTSTTDSVTFATRNTGTYYIRLGNIEEVLGVKDYKLDLTLIPRTNDSFYESITNDSIATATDTQLTPQALGSFTYEGYIGNNADFAFNEDVDIFKVELAAGQYLVIDVDTSANKTANKLDTTVRLFNANGQVVAAKDDGIANDDLQANGQMTSTYHRSDSYLEYQAQTAGTYYIGISDINNSSYDVKVAGSGTKGNAGAYKLDVRTTDIAPDHPIVELQVGKAPHVSTNSQFIVPLTVNISKPQELNFVQFEGVTLYFDYDATKMQLNQIELPPELAGDWKLVQEDTRGRVKLILERQNNLTQKNSNSSNFSDITYTTSTSDITSIAIANLKFTAKQNLTESDSLITPLGKFSKASVNGRLLSFANVETIFGSISGHLFNDVNGNSILETDESSLTGWNVYLDANNNSQFDANETNVLTDSQGNYTFSNLEQGTYIVRQVVEEGWEQTFPTETQVIGLLPTSNNSPVSGNAAADTLTRLDAFRVDPRFAGIDGKGLTSVVIDTGIDVNHPFFGLDANANGIADCIVYQQDFVDGDLDATDLDGHGSHIASIIASSDNTYPGVAPGANLIALRVGKDFAAIKQALQWVQANAAKYNIANVNLSLSDEKNWQNADGRYDINNELAALAAEDIIVTAAAGNDFAQYDDQPGVAYPAADANTIAVGAVWSRNARESSQTQNGAIDYSTASDRIVSFSQRHKELLDILAPGMELVGANATGDRTILNGTSQASAYIAGVSLLAQELALRELNRKLSVEEFRSLLKTTGIILKDGDDENDNVINTGLTFPRVDVLALGEGILALKQGNSLESISVASVASTIDSSSTVTPASNNTSNGAAIVTVAPGENITDVNFGNQSFAPSLTLNQEGINLLRLNGDLNRAKLELALTGKHIGKGNIHELGVFVVDDTSLRVNGLLPNDPGYLQAALSRSQTIFSVIPDEFVSHPTRNLENFTGRLLSFYLVQNASTDEVLNNPTLGQKVLFGSTVNNGLQIQRLDSNQFELNFEDQLGDSTADLTLNVRLTETAPPLGSKLQGKIERELIDFTEVSNQSIEAIFPIVKSEAAYENTVGFYRVENEQGTVVDTLTGQSLNPGDNGYTQAALRSASANGMSFNDQSEGMSYILQGGSIFAPFIIANGTMQQMLDQNISNDVSVYFSYHGANKDGVDHIRLLGNNTWGFEDLVGGGDKDFNDIVIQAKFQVISQN